MWAKQRLGKAFYADLQGFVMELARLEPATSWVRFGHAPNSNHLDFQAFR
jgi:hypothetical protein